MISNEWKVEFASRFRCHGEELTRLYNDLYHFDTRACEDLISLLYRAYEQRPDRLKQLDREREDDPDWYKDRGITGMQLNARSFAGTLKGVREKLDYISDCGVNYLHFMPLLESPKGRSDGGYAVSDFRVVQPELGTMEDFYALTCACHDRGIAVCLDFVMNHTSEDHEWARRARAGESAYQKYYFLYDTWDLPSAYEQTMPQVFPVTAPGNFTWCEEAQKVVMTTFYPYQWDLNYANPRVFNEMTANLLFLCNQGVDVIRLDAVPYIWKALGTSCRNLPQVHTLTRMMRMICEIVCPGTLLLGEVVMEPSKITPYFGTAEKPECHMLYNVTTMATVWHTVASRDVRLLAHQLEQVFALPRQDIFLNYLRCHDDIGWGLDYGYLTHLGQQEFFHKQYLNDYFTGKWPGSTSRGELYNNDPRLGDARLCGTTASLCGIEYAREKGDQKALDLALRLDETLHAFLFTLSGVPVLYSGDEIAQENDPSYHLDPLKKEDSRYLHRGGMDWDKAALRMDPATAEGRLFAAIRRLEILRGKLEVFGAGADAWVVNTGNDHILGIGRHCPGEKLLALFNFSDGEETAWVRDLTPYLNLITGEERDAGAVLLPPRGFLWLFQKTGER